MIKTGALASVFYCLPFRASYKNTSRSSFRRRPESSASFYNAFWFCPALRGAYVRLDSGLRRNDGDF
jgi:hypothetical protein